MKQHVLKAKELNNPMVQPTVQIGKELLVPVKAFHARHLCHQIQIQISHQKRSQRVSGEKSTSES